MSNNDDKLKNSITIGKQKIFYEVCELPQSELKFYPENPRVYSALNSDGTIPSQEVIEEHMIKQEHVRQLKDDIEKNGGLIEPIFVRNEDFVVLEGNSRLAAYRILAKSNPVEWGKIKCNLLPKDISEEMVFKLIGQFHIKGKKPWDPYEQASYLYRRSKETKIPIEQIAEDLNLKVSDAKKMVDAVDLMNKYGELDNHKYSYYMEYVKDPSIKRIRNHIEGIDEKIIGQIQKGEIKRAEDIRLLGKVAKVENKESKKLVKLIVEGKKSIYEAHEKLDESGQFETSVTKLKTFKKYINEDSFEKNVLSSKDTADKAKFEIKKIISRLSSIEKKIENEQFN